MKKTSVVLFASVVLLALFACPKVTAQSAGSKTYKIGDTGPGGGIVFYDKGFTEGGWRYLEAAPAGKEFAAIWGPRDTNVAGTETKVGSGKRNTELIVAALGENGKAAKLCASLNFNGRNDWFLPSRDELDLMYNSLARVGLGNFLSGAYWSSSQVGGNYPNVAWAQRFSDGSQSNVHLQEFTLLVRAVRAF